MNALDSSGHALTLQVNDLFATTSDPQAWEFRHPLFRRGEPHLLASIKRKSARPTLAESGTATSPTEDSNEKVAGWMRPEKPYGPPSSPPRDPHARVHGYNLNNGETVLPSTIDNRNRPVSRGRWEASNHHPTASASSRSTDAPLNRYHPDHSRGPFPPPQRYGSYPDSTYYSQADRSVPPDVQPHVALLEDQVRRLTATLNEERADNARSHLNTTSYMLQMLDWISGQTREWTTLFSIALWWRC